MSWLSVAWTRSKGTLSNVAKGVPIVGTVLSGAIDRLRTGDERRDPATGVWVNNTTGQPVATVPGEALQKVIDDNAAFNAAEWARVRGQLADLSAKAGVGGAAAIGPPGNIYQQAIAGAGQLPLILVGVGVVALLMFSKRK